MQFTTLQPLLETRGIKDTITFYTTILGFMLEGSFEEAGETVWCHLQRDGVGIMFSRPNSVMAYPAVMCSGSFYITVQNVDEVWTQLEGKCEVVYAPENFIYGMREFAIKDNNGYVLNFAQDIS